MKKNYFLRTAILLVALLSGANTGWAVSLTQDVVFNDWSKLTKNGSGGYAAYKGDQTFPGSDGVDYTWTFVADVMAENSSATAKRLQMKKSSGQLDSPTFETEQGFSITVTYESSANISITEKGTNNTVTGASPLMLEVSSLSAGISIKAGSATTYITQIEVTPTGGTSLQDPALAFTGITGDVTKQLSEGSYSSVATTASDATITYSSSNQEVATIAQDGLVTLVAGGTTTIKAEVAETATYDAASVEYTLTVVDPALIKTFAKVTSGAVTDGKYIIVYQDGNDATSVMAMNSTNTKNYFEYSEINLTDGKIVTDNQSIIWDITTQANGSMSISNGDNIFVGYRGSGNNAYIYEAYTEENCDWTFTFADGFFSCENKAVTGRLLQYNTNSPRFACYTGSQKNLTLYKLDEGKQSVTVAFNEVSGDKEVFFTESFTYNSAATATPERPITYSSSNQEVATISTEGIVTVVGPGTTIIKATTEGNDTYEEGAAQYTLTVRAASVSLPYSTDFKSGLGEWLTYVTYGTTEWGSTSYGAQANGYNKGDGETYLVSPAVSASSIVLSFGSEVAFNGPDAQLFYSSNFDPSTMTQPAEATWTEITDMATWASSQETTPSGDIELKNLTAPIRFAFKYTCSEAEGAARWTITDLSIKEGVASGIEDVEANGMKIINGKGQVTIETAEAAHVAIYALTGAQVRQLNLTEGTNIVELPAGIYVIGRQKVVVF